MRNSTSTSSTTFNHITRSTSAGTRKMSTRCADHQPHTLRHAQTCTHPGSYHRRGALTGTCRKKRIIIPRCHNTSTGFRAMDEVHDDPHAQTHKDIYRPLSSRKDYHQRPPARRLPPDIKHIASSQLTTSLTLQVLPVALASTKLNRLTT